MTPPRQVGGPVMTVRIPELVLTASERRTLLRLLDLEWARVNRERERDTHLGETALVYLQDLESLQRKLTA